jgi:hypothetical protein
METKLDALSLEYKRDYGTAKRAVNILDAMNNPNFFGPACVFGPGFSENISNLSFIDVSTVSDDSP